MITARILPHAGMGNQMFMYAAGLAVSQRLGAELAIGAWDFGNNTCDDERPYQLSCFPEITERQPSLYETFRLCPGQALMNVLYRTRIEDRHIFRRIVRKAVNMLRLGADFETGGKPSKLSRVYVQKNAGYTDELHDVPDNVILTGYWESEKYFAGISELVRKKFMFSPECFSPELSARVRACNSVAVHVRRGDKTSDKERLAASDGQYISHALEKVSSLTDSPSFFVFSDDIEWCRKNLPLMHEAEYTFVEGQTPPQDMALMTLCRHVVMGPSTFSWWGAWLSEYPGKIVTAPHPELWFKEGAYRPGAKKDVIPERWITLR